MTAEEVQQLSKTFAIYAAYYRVRLEDEVLVMYAEDLADLDVADIKLALDQYRKNPKNRIMPLPSMIRELIEPEIDHESQAREIAARINGAVVKFGYSNPNEARLFIGEIGWGIIDRRGGWSHVCQNLGVTIDPTAFEAQIREQAKSAVKYGESAVSNSLGLFPGIRRGELQSVGSIMSKLTGKTENETEDV